MGLNSPPTHVLSSCPYCTGAAIKRSPTHTHSSAFRQCRSGFLVLTRLAKPTGQHNVTASLSNHQEDQCLRFAALHKFLGMGNTQDVRVILSRGSIVLSRFATRVV